jgi:hypothetical protein
MVVNPTWLPQAPVAGPAWSLQKGQIVPWQIYPGNLTVAGYGFGQGGFGQGGFGGNPSVQSGGIGTPSWTLWTTG